MKLNNIGFVIEIDNLNIVIIEIKEITKLRVKVKPNNIVFIIEFDDFLTIEIGCEQHDCVN